MKIKFASIKVKDIKKSLKFYHEVLGLDVIDEYYSKSISVVTVSDGNISLELIKDSSDDYGLNNIGFSVSDMSEFIEKIEKSDISYNDDLVTEDNHIISLTDYDGVNINIIKE